MRAVREQRLRLALFGEARSGYVSAKTPGDRIVPRSTDDVDVVIADTGRFLFACKTFMTGRRTRKVTAALLPIP